MHDLPLISTIAAAFAAAWVLGLLCQWVRLSPIVGYLVAGVLIGPNTPGFVGNLDLAHELAEIGVILLMFGVGMHFHPKDLLAVKGIAIPGAIGQSIAATLAAAGIFTLFGISLTESIVIGMAMAVASTVVLMRVLISAGVLNSPQGHAAVGWLIVEDILTVVLLVLIPILGTSALQPAGGAPAPAPPGAGGAGGAALQIGLALLKLGVFVGLMMFAGHKLVPWMLIRIARLRSRELFTLTVLVLSIAVAAGAYFAFGASMALGAFLAGMVVAQSPVSHQAGADVLPLRDAFAVLFFVSVGMLFDPSFLVREPLMVLAGLGVVLLVKPLAAVIITALLGHPVRTGLTIAFGLAQIGEFSFIVAELARRHGIMPAEGQNVIIAAAIVSITINPMLFRAIGPLEKMIARSPRLRRLLDGRAEKRLKQLAPTPPAAPTTDAAKRERSAIIVGHGPVGQTVEQLLRERGFETVVIDMNAETVLELQRQGRRAIFGDATNAEVLGQAGVERATHLIVTLPEAPDRAAAVAAARHANETIRILVRARFLREQDALTQVGANAAIFDESEAAVALARLVLNETGTADGAEIERDAQRLRRQFPGGVLL